MEKRIWLLVVLCGWAVLALLSYFVAHKSPDIILGLMISQQVLFTVGGWMGIRNHRLLHFDGREITSGICSGMGIFLLNTILVLIVIQGLSGIFGTEQVQNWLTQERTGIQGLIDIGESHHFGLIAFLIVVGAAVSEELFFRGLLITSLQDRFGQWQSVVISALIFALAHFYLIQFLPVFISGVLLGGLFLVRRNLLRPLIAHMVVNGLALTVYLISR